MGVRDDTRPVTPEELRASMPALERTVYLNTGAAGPSPESVVEAMSETAQRQAYRAPAEGGAYAAATETFDAAREAAADLLGAAPSEVALTDSTTDGVNRVAAAIDWSAGDAVVRTDLEHSAGILPWERLGRSVGVETRVVETDAGRLDPADVRRAAEGTELVCFSAVDWLYGRRHPVSDVVEAAHDAGARVLVDAVQAVGQTEVDVTEWGADYVAAAGHKWLLGPMGAGVLYVRDGAEADLEPASIGYRSVADANAETYEYRPGAGRFEVGTQDPATYAGLRAGIEAIRGVGLDAVESHIEELTDRLKAGLGDGLLSPREFHSGLVSFAADDPAATVRRLDDANVKVRSLPSGAVRASVHAFNTRADVDALLDAL